MKIELYENNAGHLFARDEQGNWFFDLEYFTSTKFSDFCMHEIFGIETDKLLARSSLAKKLEKQIGDTDDKLNLIAVYDNCKVEIIRKYNGEPKAGIAGQLFLGI